MRWNRHRLSVIQQALCVSVLFGVVCPLSLVISYTSEDKHRVRADSIYITCRDLGYTQFESSDDGSLWGRAVCTTSHGTRLSSVPSGDRSANPATDGASGRSGLQRALLSVSSTRKRSRTERLAAPSRVSRAARSDVPCWSSASGHRASSSKHIRGQSRETGSFSRSPGGVGSPAKHVSLGPA